MTIMSEMVERVAQAIAGAVPYTDELPPDGWQKETWLLACRTMAGAAIEAMREPTDEMVYALGFKDGPLQAWTVMIDAALSPHPKTEAAK